MKIRIEIDIKDHYSDNENDIALVDLETNLIEGLQDKEYEVTVLKIEKIEE